MRTKTLALSALLGMIGSASLMAQSTNVYSLNAVGYINVTMPPGFSIVTCPLICGTDPTAPANANTNTLNVIFPNPSATTPYAYAQVFTFINGSFANAGDQGGGAGVGGGWDNGGTYSVAPGVAIFWDNPSGTPMTATFVGTVPQGSLTNALASGYNLVGSIVPISGDLATNTVLNIDSAAGPFDYVLLYDPTANPSQPSGQTGYEAYSQYGFSGSWSGGTNDPAGSGDPYVPSVSQGFFYYNATAQNNGAATEYWVENFSINP
jgi:hypothetical protein